ncbi:MAG: chemotaxis signal transduction protein [Spirochaetes bacterium]|nr:MAG: chemotaxis signal transduction protein [Spirochaetota bacterium]
MSEAQKVLVFSLDERPFGIPADKVVHVYPSVLPLLIPSAPESIPGVVDIHGQVMPLVDMRKKCGLPSRPIGLSDQLVQISLGNRNLALLVDQVDDIVEIENSEILDPESLIPGVGLVQGLLRHGQALGLLYRLETFFAAEFSFEPGA